MALAYPTAKDVFHSAWNAVGLVMRQARGTALIACSIYLAVDLCKSEVPSVPAISTVLRVLLDALSTIFLIPFQIITYRLIILGEQPSRYLAYFSRRFRPYLTWTMIFWLPALAGEVLTNVSLIATWSTILMIIGIFVGIRLAVLFPALAAGREDVTVKDAWQDARGRVWIIIRIWLPIIVVFFGIIAAWIVIFNFVGMTSSASGLSFWRIAVQYALTSASVLIGAIVMMANTALIFDLIGNRVKHGT